MGTKGQSCDLKGSPDWTRIERGCRVKERPGGSSNWRSLSLTAGTSAWSVTHSSVSGSKGAHKK